MLRKNLEREMITEDELNSQLRQSGIDELTTVKRARLEPDGHISVIKSLQPELQRKRGGHPRSGVVFHMVRRTSIFATADRLNCRVVPRGIV